MSFTLEYHCVTSKGNPFIRPIYLKTPILIVQSCVTAIPGDPGTDSRGERQIKWTMVGLQIKWTMVGLSNERHKKLISVRTSA